MMIIKRKLVGTIACKYSLIGPEWTCRDDTWLIQSACRQFLLFYINRCKRYEIMYHRLAFTICIVKCMQQYKEDILCINMESDYCQYAVYYVTWMCDQFYCNTNLLSFIFNIETIINGDTIFIFWLCICMHSTVKL